MQHWHRVLSATLVAGALFSGKVRAATGNKEELRPLDLLLEDPIRTDIVEPRL